MKLAEVIHELRKPIPDSKISTKKISGQTIKFVSWTDLCDILDTRVGTGNWSWEITQMFELSPISQISGSTDNGEAFTRAINARLVVIGKLTIFAEDRTISNCATGEELLNCSNYGDPASNAEASSFRRCCAKFGLGRYLWQKR